MLLQHESAADLLYKLSWQCNQRVVSLQRAISDITIECLFYRWFVGSLTYITIECLFYRWFVGSLTYMTRVLYKWFVGSITYLTLECFICWVHIVLYFQVVCWVHSIHKCRVLYLQVVCWVHNMHN